VPNHVYTQMQVEGEPEAIKAFAEKHFIDGQFNLDSFIKRPDCLEGTTSPAEPPRNGTPEEIANWHKESDAMIAECGFNNWYDWTTKNWGTKWNAYDGEMDTPADGVISCSFQTAWALPDLVFKVMAKLYPNLNFFIETVEEGGWFAGTIDIVDGDIIENLSQDQWKQYAASLLGWEDTEDEDNKERVELALGELKNGNVSDSGVINQIANYIKCNMDDFIEFSK